MASDLVADCRPPLVSETSTEGTVLFAWSTRLVVSCTMWPPSSWRSICAMASCVVLKKPVRLTPDQRVVVLGGVVGERLGDEDPGVVHECVHPAEVADSGIDDDAGDGWIGDVTGDGDHAYVMGSRDRARVGDDGSTVLSVGLHERGADAPRRGAVTPTS